LLCGHADQNSLIADYGSDGTSSITVIQAVHKTDAASSELRYG
jgi:hypothetical protein